MQMIKKKSSIGRTVLSTVAKEIDGTDIVCRTSDMFVVVCKRSTFVAQSSTEAEFYCLAEACRELLWIRSLLQEILEEIPYGIFFQNDTSTINVVSNEGVNERTKHIDVKFHFVMKLKSSGEAEFPHISSTKMCADVFTKEL